MRKLVLLLLLLLVAGGSIAQTTPNYGFQVPPFNAPNWNTSMNQNWYSLDTILTGVVGGSGLQCKPLASLPPAPSSSMTFACCADCQATNPCSGGGSGNLAIGLNGQYNCASGSGSGGGGLADPGSSNVFVFRAGTIDVTRPATGTDLLSSFFTGPFSSACFLRGDLNCVAPPGSGVTASSTSPGPFAAYFGTAPSTQVQPDPNITTDFSGHMTAVGMVASILSATGTGGNGPIYPNANPGTTSGLIAKIVAGQAVTTTTSDTALPVAIVLPTVTNGSSTICAAGNTGNACLAYSGQAACTFDAAGGTANHFVGTSTATAGRCMDLGGVLPVPSPGAAICTVGTLSATTAANASGLVNAAPFCYSSPSLSHWEIDIPFAFCSGVGTAQLGMDPPPSGAAMTAGGCTGTNVDQATAVAANSGTPALQYSFRLPQTLAGTADVYLTYYSAATSSTFTPVVDAICNPTNGSATNDPAFSAGNFFAPGSQTTPSTTLLVQTVSTTGISWPASCTAGTMLHLRPKRTDTAGAATVNFVTLHIVGSRAI